jgi:predicted metal-binding membrane protein
MNLVWIAVLATVVLIEKVAPRAQALGVAGGAALVIAGVVMLLHGGR